MSSIKKTIDRLFGELPTPYGELCQNPITGGWFLGGIDPIAEQRRLARRALLARRWCAKNDPPGLPPRPLDGVGIQDMKRGQGLLHLFAYYAQSIAARGWVVGGHPHFDEYARGMLTSPFAPHFFKENEELLKRFPPRPLAGLGPGCTWLPPQEHAERMAIYHRSRAREAAVERRLSAA
jgi:hypothetical protein